MNIAEAGLTYIILGIALYEAFRFAVNKGWLWKE